MNNIKLIGHPDFSDVIGKKIVFVRKSSLYLAIHFENNECCLLAVETLSCFKRLTPIFSTSQISWDEQLELGILTKEEKESLEKLNYENNKKNLLSSIFELIKEYEDTYNERVFTSK